MKKVSGGFAPWTPGERTEKGEGKGKGERERRRRRYMEKEGLKKGKGNWEAWR
jgi:hypothetical protein